MLGQHGTWGVLPLNWGMLPGMESALSIGVCLFFNNLSRKCNDRCPSMSGRDVRHLTAERANLGELPFRFLIFARAWWVSEPTGLLSYESGFPARYGRRRSSRGANSLWFRKGSAWLSAQ